jgi:hypothetical protein
VSQSVSAAEEGLSSRADCTHRPGRVGTGPSCRQPRTCTPSLPEELAAGEGQGPGRRHRRPAQMPMKTSAVQRSLGPVAAATASSWARMVLQAGLLGKHASGSAGVGESQSRGIV